MDVQPSLLDNPNIAFMVKESANGISKILDYLCWMRVAFMAESYSNIYTSQIIWIDMAIYERFAKKVLSFQYK